MKSASVTLEKFNTLIEAEMAQATLEEAGIKSELVGLLIGGWHPAEIRVSAEDLDRAVSVLKQAFKSKNEVSPSDSEAADDRMKCGSIGSSETPSDDDVKIIPIEEKVFRFFGGALLGGIIGLIEELRLSGLGRGQADDFWIAVLLPAFVLGSVFALSGKDGLKKALPWFKW